MPTPPAISDYDLLHRIGSGSYGEVWLARSSATGVRRAVKIVRRDRFVDDRPFQREFEGIRKFEPLSRSHPSQLALFHVGRNEAEGCFYYVMELADARPAGGPRARNESAPEESKRAETVALIDHYLPDTLRADLEDGRLPADRVLEIGLALAEALDHLHGHGLVHRDVKPSNIIFVDGRPKLADIGLVTDASDTHSIVGTEGYLAPEGPGLPAADLYALGKVLYEALTGMDRRQFPELPSEVRDWPDRERVYELNAVLGKACATKPEERHASVAELLAELRLLQEGRSIRQRRGWQETRKRLRRVALPVALLLVAGWLVLRGERGVLTEDQLKTRNPAAYAFWEQAKACDEDSREGYNEAIRLSHEVFAMEPRFIEAPLMTAAQHLNAAGWLGPDNVAMPSARAALHQAFAIDPDSARGWALLGAYYWTWEWDFIEAEKCYRRGVSKRSQDPFNRWSYALFLGAQGRQAEARFIIDEAERLNLDKLLLGLVRINESLAEGRHDEAVATALELRQRFSEEFASIAYLHNAYFYKGDYGKAVECAQEILRDRDEPGDMAMLAYSLARLGRRQEALDLQEKLRQLARTRDISSANEAIMFAGFEDWDATLIALQRAVERRDNGLVFLTPANLRFSPVWDPIRSDPRFQELLARVRPGGWLPQSAGKLKPGDNQQPKSK